jgi:catechol 2,3-dioxygenase-like lactoylglutathione lyase family enzyme
MRCHFLFLSLALCRQEIDMLDHMTFRVADIERTRSFYAAALAPLGYQQRVNLAFDGVHVVGFGVGDKVDTWFADGPSPHGGHPVTTGCHLARSAPDRAAVDAFHAAALAAGGRANGPPGVRAMYRPHDHGAFVIDPDGNNIETVCHQPA